MGRYVNSVIPYAAYEDIFSDKYFVDKSMLLDELISTLGLKNRFLCVTRPRRFGKSVMANMIGAFFGKAQDASMVFDHLSIAHVPGYHKHLNQHNVLYIDFSRLPRNCTSYEQYINRIQDGINQDLKDIYPDLRINIEDATWGYTDGCFSEKI